MSTDQSALSILLPAKLLSQLEVFRLQGGMSSSSDAVVAILEQYFATADFETADFETTELETAPLAQSDGVLKRLAALEKHVLDLNKQIVQLRRTVSFMPGSAIALTLEHTSNDSTGAVGREQLGIFGAIGDFTESIDGEDEDLEDEPDEILYDFLEPESDF